MSKGSAQHTEKANQKKYLLGDLNPTESTQAYQQHSLSKLKAAKSPKKFIKSFKTGFQLIQKQKTLKDMILKSLSLKESIKIFTMNTENVKVLQQLLKYNKANFQLLLKLIYYQGYKYQHFQNLLTISFQKITTYQQFCDMLLKETGDLGTILSQNLNMIFKKKILKANQNCQKNKKCLYEYFQFFKKLKRKTKQKIFDIIYDHFQYIESIFQQIEKVVQLYQNERNNGMCHQNIGFGQHIRKILLNTVFLEEHIFKFLIDVNEYFQKLEHLAYETQHNAKRHNLFFIHSKMRYQSDIIIQNIKEAQFDCEQITEDNNDSYDDGDNLSSTQSQMEEERQLIEFRKQQKRKEKRKRKKKKQQEKKQKMQNQILMQQQEESCQNLIQTISNINQIYKNVKFEKIKLRIDSKAYKNSNCFKII